MKLLNQNNPNSFRRSLQRQDRIEGSLLKKMAVGAVVMTAFVGVMAIRVMVATHGDDAKIDSLIATITLVSAATSGAVIGATLALKDHIQRKVDVGENVPAALRLLFGSGVRSLAFWVGLIFFVCLVLLPVVLTIRPF